MGTFTPMRSAAGNQFMQWRATYKGETAPPFGPSHPTNPVCVFCGAEYRDHVVTVEGREYMRTDIAHDWDLHRTHPGIRDDDEPVVVERPRRAWSDDDD